MIEERGDFLKKKLHYYKILLYLGDRESFVYFLIQNKMKQPPFKKLFIIVGSLIVLSGFVWVIAQSDTASLVINTDRFNAVQEIQEVHINEQQGAALSSTKAGMKVEKSGVLGIGTVDTRTNRVGALKNTVNSDTSVIAGSGNRNEA